MVLSSFALRLIYQETSFPFVYLWRLLSSLPRPYASTSSDRLEVNNEYFILNAGIPPTFYKTTDHVYCKRATIHDIDHTNMYNLPQHAFVFSVGTILPGSIGYDFIPTSIKSLFSLHAVKAKTPTELGLYKTFTWLIYSFRKNQWIALINDVDAH
jgi:hypothetical protein